MLAHTLGSEARDARILTQRLYGQCRTTASSWRALSQALRRLRNSIEELEDLILDEALGQIATVPILTSLQACVQVLRDLDRQLQLYRCSDAESQAFVEQTVAEINTSLAETTLSFEEACRQSSNTDLPQTASNVSTTELHNGAPQDSKIMAPALRADEIIICLDDQMPLDEAVRTARMQTKSSSLPLTQASTGLQSIVQLSTPSKALDQQQHVAHDRDEQGASLELKPHAPCDTSGKLREDEDDAACFPLPESPLNTTNGQAHTSVSFEDTFVPQDLQKLRFVSPSTSGVGPSLFGWQTPFAEIDPLSVDFESATSYLLGTPRTSTETHRSGYTTRTVPSEPPTTTTDASSARSSNDQANRLKQPTKEGCKDVSGDHVPHQSWSGGEIVNAPPGHHLSELGAPGKSDNHSSDKTTKHSPSHSSKDSASKDIEVPCKSSELVDEYNELLVDNAGPASGKVTTALGDDASEKALPPPVSKFAPDQRQSNSRLSAESGGQSASRTDSKMDLHFSAPTSPGDSPAESLHRHQNQHTHYSTTSQHRVQSRSTSTTTAASDLLSRASLEVSYDSQDEQQAYSRSLSEVTLPQLNVITEVKRAVPPPPLPPKGRYHIVNPSPRSRSQSLEDPVLPPRPATSEMETSGEIPMILVQESQSVPAAILKALETEQGHDRRPASAGVTSPTNRQSKRYYRQSFVRTDQQTSQAPDPVKRSAETNTPTAADHASFVEEAFQETPDVDLIRIDSICHSWQRQEWTRVEAYLLAYYEICIANDDSNTVRRIRHLLGVSASFQGQWQRAITYFISALNVPLKEASSIDEGDRAALTWLADCYILCNRRLEAFVANTLAMQGLAAQSKQSSLLTVLYAEQKAILSGGSAAQLELKWNQLTIQQIAATSDTIVSHEIVSPNLIEICFNQPAGNPGQLPKPTTPLPRNRATILCELDDHNTPLAAHMEFKITHDSFRPEARWPMPYDPFFAAEQAAKGRLCDHPCDLLALVKTTPPIKIPKNGPLGSSRFACFTCADLEWLVSSVRDCLRYMEMKWDEVANAQGVWFTARFAMRHQNVLTAVYFAISLFKQSMRQGYGIEVCVDGVRSARVMHDSLEYPMGVHYSCEKRLKKFFSDYLSKAHRHWFKGGKSIGSLPAAEVVSGELARDAHQFMASKAQRVVAKDLPLLPKSEVARYT